MAQVVLSAQNRSFLERLHTLRHLPPGTSLPQISVREDRHLLEEILQLSDETDVFSWLQDHSETYLRITLRIIIEQLCTMCRDIHASASKVPIPEYYRQLFGGLLELSEDELPFDALNNLPGSNDEGKRLSDILQQLQSASQKSPVLSLPFQGRTERDQVFADLIQLSPNADPLSWLKKMHTLFTTQVILSHLLNRFDIAHGSLATLPTISMLKVKKHLHPSSAIDLFIEHITFKSEGILLQARITFSPDKLLPHENTTSSNFTWGGFERMRDNHGYNYLTWVEEMHSGSGSFRKQQEEITMAFYPAPGPSIRELTFSCQPMVIDASAASQEKHRIQSSHIVADTFEWHVSL